MYYEKQKSYDKTELTFQPTLVSVSETQNTQNGYTFKVFNIMTCSALVTNTKQDKSEFINKYRWYGDNIQTTVIFLYKINYKNSLPLMGPSKGERARWLSEISFWKALFQNFKIAPSYAFF